MFNIALLSIYIYIKVKYVCTYVSSSVKGSILYYTIFTKFSMYILRYSRKNIVETPNPNHPLLTEARVIFCVLT